MFKSRKIRIMTFLLLFLCIGVIKVYAEPANNIPVPKLNISVDGSQTPKEYVDNIKLLILLTLLTLLPSIILTMTSFTRISVVFGFLRNALGTQQSPSNQVLIGLALFLTLFIMTPTFNKINDEAIVPYVNNQIDQTTALKNAEKPLRDFMFKQTRQKDLKLFMDIAKVDENTKIDDMPITVVIPSYIISELKTAFTIGFLLFIPFLIIDIVVASVLMSMGMMMIPPAMVAMPFKILLFVMVDGWYLIVKSLVMSFS